ncbi:phosphatidylinositol N-acetylglucosaminyltransferase subunit H [Ixodes scapularis]
MNRAKRQPIPDRENDPRSLSATSDDAQEACKSSRVLCESASGEPLVFCSTNYGENLGHEYVFKHKAFNTKRWMLLTTFFLSCFLHYGLHRRDVDFLGVFLVVLLLLLVAKLHRRVKEESLLVMQSLGLQTTTTFVTGRRVSRFINKEFIEDVVISEAITVQSVIFYLVVLLHDKVGTNSAPSLVPLFHNTLPRLSALQAVYRGIQESGWT